MIGGLHLREAKAVRLDSTLEALLEIDPDLVVPCHCSGPRAIEALQAALGDRIQPGAAGATFVFGGSATGTEPRWPA